MAKQLNLPIKPRFKHGGARPGAGRPKTSKFQPHARRRVFQARHPLHITVRIREGLPNLRGKEAFRDLKQAVTKARKQGLSIAHFAILSNHLHLLIESQDRNALAKQMQSLGISFAKRLNTRLKRKGAVLRERYHAHILKTPSEVKRALGYVLSNEYKHAGSRGRILLDAFSSALTVPDETWQRLLGSRWRSVVGFPEVDPDKEEALRSQVAALLSPPRTWLLTRGWTRAK